MVVSRILPHESPTESLDVLFLHFATLTKLGSFRSLAAFSAFVSKDSGAPDG